MTELGSAQGSREMDDERWEPGMPVLDRQAVAATGEPAVGGAPAGGSIAPEGRPSARAAGPPARGGEATSRLPPSLAAPPPRSVPETRPTPLQGSYVTLSVVVLLCGFIAITALELGAPPTSPLVRLCVIVGAPILVVTTLDASLRIWRSAWAWMPVDRAKGLFRLTWLVVAAVGIVAVVGASVAVLAA